MSLEFSKILIFAIKKQQDVIVLLLFNVPVQG